MIQVQAHELENDKLYLMVYKNLNHESINGDGFIHKFLNKVHDCPTNRGFIKVVELGHNINSIPRSSSDFTFNVVKDHVNEYYLIESEFDLHNLLSTSVLSYIHEDTFKFMGGKVETVEKDLSRKLSELEAKLKVNEDILKSLDETVAFYKKANEYKDIEIVEKDKKAHSLNMRISELETETAKKVKEQANLYLQSQFDFEKIKELSEKLNIPIITAQQNVPSVVENSIDPNYSKLKLDYDNLETEYDKTLLDNNALTARLKEEVGLSKFYAEKSLSLEKEQQSLKQERDRFEKENEDYKNGYQSILDALMEANSLVANLSDNLAIEKAQQKNLISKETHSTLNLREKISILQEELESLKEDRDAQERMKNNSMQIISDLNIDAIKNKNRIAELEKLELDQYGKLVNITSERDILQGNLNRLSRDYNKLLDQNCSVENKYNDVYRELKFTQKELSKHNEAYNKKDNDITKIQTKLLDTESELKAKSKALVIKESTLVDFADKIDTLQNEIEVLVSENEKTKLIAQQELKTQEDSNLFNLKNAPLLVLGSLLLKGAMANKAREKEITGSNTKEIG